ncbi:hypothetical protein LWI29_009039 [Acer saccharum]|uniref:MULE transposase domain-containing protein n=1 Tax=Acer saccharum TaxID=4024 RepID=A0AA39SRJ4_ACESA|nr:hypothetical protein LWI29_009039 [Acer saccharum]
MIYPLAFGFAHSECTESWTWFLKQLRNVIQYPERVMFVSDRHAGIFAGMEAIFHDAAHGVCAYHLSQNLKKFCRQRDDMIKLSFRATYLYSVEEFNCEMAELKAAHRKVYDELLETNYSDVALGDISDRSMLTKNNVKLLIEPTSLFTGPDRRKRNGTHTIGWTVRPLLGLGYNHEARDIQFLRPKW